MARSGAKPDCIFGRYSPEPVSGNHRSQKLMGLKGLYDKSCRLHHIPNATSAEAASKFPPTGSQPMAAEAVLTGGSADMVGLIGSFARSCGGGRNSLARP